MPKIIDDEQVFRAAIEIFVSKGYENATTKAIAAAADIHEATLFRKYGSKFELIDQAIQHQFSDTPLNKLIYTGELEADLRSILQAYVEVSKMYGNIILLLFFEVARDSALQRFMDTPWKNIQSILNILEKYQTQGLLKKEPLLNTLYALIGPIMISHMAQRTKVDVPVPEVDLRQQLDSFLYGRSQQT